MSRRLIAYVHVDGVAYGPDSEVPPKVAKQIGEHAWTDADSSPEVPAPTGAGGGSEDEAPPRSGRGSGVEAWRVFAEQHDVEVAADASREDIIAACEAAELIEPEQRKE
ncbi:hypothetical protein [Streptomyces seoulensis]|uniref:hypothetical protein n=1 Tax=Streptomyces seoulensis TaxID=73044 RepID=UPI001FCC27ED|nr:hypothetical protein [Streptomyces seoulensis]BDH04900.1 hypothetical protein HEK131_21270 [Streptomyces seoulensis]